MTATDERPDEAAPPPDPNAVAVTINGRAITARKGELVIAAAQRHDIYVPRFCYHERMNPVGMCRMCLVDIDTGRGPMLQPSCMVTVAPDMKVETESPAAKRAQEGVIELLLANHPLDCPVCDKGGECPLQDQAYSHGPGESRYVEEKRHFEKPIPISDLVLLDRERCILCDRCTRFADEVAGDALIHFTQRGNETQVMTFPDLPFSSYFSGNTVQICPVGALDGDAVPVQGAAVGPRRVGDDVHDVLGRLPDDGAVEPRPPRPPPRRRQRRRQLGLAVRPRPVQLRGGQLHRAGHARRSSAVRVGSGRCPGGQVVTARRRGPSPSPLSPRRCARRSTPAGRSASPCSAARAAPTRTPSPGPASPTPSASSTATPSSATGCRPSSSTCPGRRSTSTTAAPTVILLGPDLKEELPVLHLRLRDSAVRKTHAAHRAGAGGDRADPAGLALDSASSRAGPRPRRRRSPTHSSSTSSAAGPVVIVAGRANLAESTESAAATLRAVYDAVAAVQPEVTRAPGAAARQRRRGAAARPASPPRRSRRRRHPRLPRRAARSTSSSSSVPTRSPTSPTPRWPGRRSIGPGSSSPSMLSSPPRRRSPTSCCRRRCSPRRAARRRTSRAGSRRSPSGSPPAGTVAGRLDGRRRARRPAPLRRAGADPARCGVDHRRHRRAGAGLRRGHSLGVDWQRRRRARRQSPASRQRRVRRHAGGDRNSYDYRVVLARRLYDRATATAMSPSLAGLAGDSDARVNPADADKISAPEDGTVRLTGARGSVAPRRCAAIPPSRGAPCSSRSTAAPTSTRSSTPPPRADRSSCASEAGPTESSMRQRMGRHDRLRSAACRRAEVDAADHHRR